MGVEQCRSRRLVPRQVSQHSATPAPSSPACKAPAPQGKAACPPWTPCTGWAIQGARWAASRASSGHPTAPGQPSQVGGAASLCSARPGLSRMAPARCAMSAEEGSPMRGCGCTAPVPHAESAHPAVHGPILEPAVQLAAAGAVARPAGQSDDVRAWIGRVKHRMTSAAGPAPVVELFSASAFVPACVHERLPPCIFVNDLAMRDQARPACRARADQGWQPFGAGACAAATAPAHLSWCLQPALAPPGMTPLPAAQHSCAIRCDTKLTQAGCRVRRSCWASTSGSTST